MKTLILLCFGAFAIRNGLWFAIGPLVLALDRHAKGSKRPSARFSPPTLGNPAPNPSESLP